MTGRERVLRALHGETTDALPNIAITMMKATDAVGVPYRRYATDAGAQVRGQIAISRAFSIDHVSGISDPAVEASDLGAEILYREDAPPAVDEAHALLAKPALLAELRVPDPHAAPRMSNRVEVIRRLSREVGHRIMTDFYDDPGFVRDLMGFVLEVETAFAAAQVEAVHRLGVPVRLHIETTI